MAVGEKSPPQRTEIERIVRAVLAEMSRRTPESAVGAPSNGELVLAGRVVSLSEIEGRLKGVSRLVIPRGTVLTPAARDLLKQLGVTIASQVTTAGAASRSLVLAVHDKSSRASGLTAALAGESGKIDQCAAGDLVSAVNETVNMVLHQNKLGMVITDRSAAALCLANRRAGVRAALGTSLAAVSDALATIAANVLIVDPRGHSTFEIREMVRLFARADRRECPAEFQQLLN